MEAPRRRTVPDLMARDVPDADDREECIESKQLLFSQSTIPNAAMDAVGGHSAGLAERERYDIQAKTSV